MTFAQPDETGEGGSLHEQTVNKLRMVLLNGELSDGARIPEAQLCLRFGVSRTPLREALKVLAAEGFVELRPNRGSIVAPIDPLDVAHVFELKGAIENQIGLLAAVRATPEDRARIERVHGALGAHPAPTAYTELNQEFHRALASATQNPVLLQTYDNLQKRVLRLRFVVNENPVRVAQSFDEHEAIMTAFRARARLDLAERLAEHNRLTGEAVLRTLRGEGIAT
ncbi:GntR family transcriptional regulator [Ancylobacter pratisalsi]|uniref:GntR family transcriptional regulator n=1 Tax=Ancylobacter pratisalsi TaxID=1745854 RepID=A0A6P1YP26_9HYPH|nr:GntR family transcriptional regulator [Ancylobacter pratisalsi]QIB35227.1 GntR family transcriptional regulator [Ancylobacter pratisalsi]